MNRPWCCPEPRCEPVHQLSESFDLAIPTPGMSFSCFGRMGEEIRFTYDGEEHPNDLRSCHYTPLKGVVMWQENPGDWAVVRDAYSEALVRLERIVNRGAVGHSGQSGHVRVESRLDNPEGSDDGE